MLPLLKLALPALLVAGGGTALIVAGQGESTQAVTTSGVWIDSPISAVPVGPGAITVSAHASSASGIEELELLVDGEVVGSDAELETNDGLVFAELRWDAAVGDHQLTVRDAGDEALASDTMLVQVIEGAPVPKATTTTRPGPTTTTEPGETTTTSESTTTTTSTTVPPEITDTVPPAVTTTTTRPPATTVPADPPPIIDAANFSGPTLLYSPPCGYSVVVTARIRNAASATAIVQGTTVQVPMSRSGASFTGTIASGFPTSEVGNHLVTVTASGPGGETSRDVGVVEIRLTCPKD